MCKNTVSTSGMNIADWLGALLYTTYLLYSYPMEKK
jgi:hypothetical protein